MIAASSQTEGRSNSKDSVLVVQSGDKLLLQKRFTHDIARASKNVNKQLGFQCNTNSLVAAPIVNVEYAPDALEVHMPYIEGVCGSDIAVFGTVQRSTNLRLILSAYLNEMLQSAKTDTVPVSLFSNKMQSVADQTSNQATKNAIQSTFEELESSKLSQVEVPMGQCHGDLNLNNMIVAPDGRIYLIDFLNTYLESPLQDLAKLMQDFRFGWCVRYHSLQFRRRFSVFSRQVMPNPDVFIQENFRPAFELIMALTIMRIAPYAKDDETHHWIQTALTNLTRAEKKVSML